MPHYNATPHGVARRFSRMTARLEPLRDALCAVPDDALIALRHDAIHTRYLAPSFTAWVKHMVDWELDRRTGMHYFLLLPEELVQPREFARGASHALDVIAAEFGPNDRPVARLLDALRELVSCSER